MKKIKNYVSNKQLKEIYYAYFQSYLEYCILVWGNMEERGEGELEKLCRRGRKCLENKNNDNGTEEIMNMKELYEYKLAILMYKRMKMGLYEESIEVERRENARNLREGRQWLVPKIRTEQGRQSIDFRGIRYWVEIPQQIRESISLREFKIKIKMMVKRRREI